METHQEKEVGIGGMDADETGRLDDFSNDYAT